MLRVNKCGRFKTCSNVGDVAEDIVEGEEVSNWAEAGEVVVARVLINIWMKKMTMLMGQWEMTVLLMPMVMTKEPGRELWLLQSRPRQWPAIKLYLEDILRIVCLEYILKTAPPGGGRAHRRLR